MKTKILALLALNLCLSSIGAEKKPGTVLWAFETEGPIESSPAIGTDGTVYVGTHRKEGGNKIYALDGKTGAKKWEFGIEDGRVHESPAIGTDGTVYICSNEKKVYALEGKTGAKKWVFGIGSGTVSTSLIIGDDSTLYFGSFDGVGSKIYALNEKTGSKKWEFNTLLDDSNNPDFKSPGSIVIEPDGTVCFDTFGGNFYALDGKTGVKKRKFKMIGYVRTSPAIGSDGIIYFSSSSDSMSGPFSSGKIYALDSKTGTKKWELKTGDQGRSSPAMGSDGTLYIGSKDKKIYAIKTDSKGPAKSLWPMRGQNARHTGRVMKK